MIKDTIKILAYYQRTGNQLSYHQSFDGGDYTIEFTEKCKVWIDKDISSLDYRMLYIINCFICANTSSYIEEDISGLIEMEYSGYDCLSLSDLVNALNTVNVKFEPVYKEPKCWGVYHCLNDVYSSVVLSNLEEDACLIDSQLTDKQRILEETSSEIDQLIAKKERIKAQIEGEIKDLINLRQGALYKRYRQAIIEKLFPVEYKLPLYNKFPIELAIENKDCELFTFLTDNVFKLFGLEYKQSTNNVFSENNSNLFKYNCIDSFQISRNGMNTIYDSIFFAIENSFDAKKIIDSLCLYKDCICVFDTFAFVNLKTILFMHRLCVDTNVQCYELLSDIFRQLDSSETLIFIEIWGKLYEMFDKYKDFKQCLLSNDKGFLASTIEKIENSIRRSFESDDFLTKFHEHKIIFMGIADERMKAINTIIDFKTRIIKEDTAVDLGLESGTRWAKFNIGWFGKYRFCDSAECSDTISCYPQSRIFSLGQDIAQIATQKRWSIPTKEQFREIIENCEWIWQNGGTQKDGSVKMSGYWVVGKNGNRVFFNSDNCLNSKPATNERGCYWTSSCENIAFNRAYSLIFSENRLDLYPSPILEKMYLKPVLNNPHQE